MVLDRSFEGQRQMSALADADNLQATVERVCGLSDRPECKARLEEGWDRADPLFVIDHARGPCRLRLGVGDPAREAEQQPKHRTGPDREPEQAG